MYTELCLAYKNNTLSINDFARLSTLKEESLFQLLEDAKKVLEANYVITFKSFVQCYNSNAYVWDKIQ